MSAGNRGRKMLTVEDLPRLVSGVADRASDRIALRHNGIEVTYQTLHQQLQEMDAAMGGSLPPDALVPVVLSNLLPDLIASGDGAFGRVVDAVIADASSIALEDGNPLDYEAAGTLVALFDRQVAASPEATAVEFEDESLTYAEFDARVNRLARHLISLGVGPEAL